MRHQPARVLKFRIVARNRKAAPQPPAIERLANTLRRMPEPERTRLVEWIETLAAVWEKKLKAARKRARNIGKPVIDIDADSTRPVA